MRELARWCDEFLVHAVDVEGLCRGVDLELVRRLGRGSPIPVTYAGGASELRDLEEVGGEDTAARLGISMAAMKSRLHRARAAVRAADAHAGINENAVSSAWDRMNQKVNRADAVSQARTELLGDNVDDQFAALEKHDEVERLLAGLKSKKEVA